MKTRKILLILFIGLLTLTGCNKYSDGPLLSLRTKKQRAVAEWDVKSFTYNNEDVLNSSYSSSLTCSDGYSVYFTDEYKIPRMIWTIEKTGTFNIETTYDNRYLLFDVAYDLCYDSYDYDNGTELDKGEWQFTSNNEKIEFKFNTSNFWSNSGDVWEFEIKELREKQMKLEGIVDGDILKITLVKR
jgi:hypothetical protein